MKVSTILDQIDSGHFALPEFQRGYVWNRNQVRNLFDSLYRKRPVGSLLVWVTDAATASRRGDGQQAADNVRLLLDGQQRMTSLYGVARAKPPEFFDGDPKAFTGLHFHLASERFEFYQPVEMKGNPLWIDVTRLIMGGNDEIDPFVHSLKAVGEKPHYGKFNAILSIRDRELHVEEVTTKLLDEVVEIFNLVNTGGTKLSKGDLALAKICAGWREGRKRMRESLDRWESEHYSFKLDWLLRSVNAVLTGEAQFHHLHDRSADDVRAALNRTTKHIDGCLSLIGDRLGLDHDQVFFGKGGVPVMIRYLDQRAKRKLGPMSGEEQDKLLFWFVQAAMWGRFSGSTESALDQDLRALEGEDGSLDRLLNQLRTWRGGSMRAIPQNFENWSKGARFYPVLYMLTRMGEARDWGTGHRLKASMRGKGSRLEVHHIFPKARLYNENYGRARVNALGNFCFLTQNTNLKISDRLPEAYFPEVEERHPGALDSQWIPADRDLWTLDRYPDFLRKRSHILADALNRQLEELLHGDLRWMKDDALHDAKPEIVAAGRVSIGEEEEELERLNKWVESVGLPIGELEYDLADESTGQQDAVIDLAWPHGLQEELSEPVAVLLNEDASTIAKVSQAGFRCFDNVSAFKQYVRQHFLGEYPGA